ncbi:urea carboxylase-associated family protein [Rathayibacter sp. ZW T2_19]|uniref:Urea carboxylase-associated family protein n=1 Tax=Rathayibacter rubneri TaxID=2950106 RepID=A0A9X2DVX9_9MICO|nr:urea amidolyase associated protein UAAP1 [Rathayibacter rubneri]MCM6761513.1 urea carboxylase-associated family protein [Rathayibacter rubneri]
MTASTTSTTAGARAHARAQEGTAAETGPLVPASLHADPPAGVAAEDLRWSERIAGGGYAHRALARGTHLRLTDVTGDACVSLLLYSAAGTHERLNVADTVKVQWQVYAGAGQLLLSDQGRVLASTVADDSGHHDTIFGTTALARNVERYGDGSPQGPSPAGRELLLLGAAKQGLGRRDLAPSVSYFQGVRIRADGSPEFLGSAGPGRSVVLRLEMPAIVLLANTAHPLDPRPAYSCGPVDVLAWRGEPAGPDDPLRSATPEGRRAFLNTDDFLQARGIA